jgi:indole-3-glycerol phosphate synthase
LILDEILEHKREEVSQRKRAASEEEVREAAVKASPVRPPRFDGPMSVIAEVKRMSPSAGAIAAGLDPVEQALRYQEGGAAAISVLADERFFGGSLNDLRAVCEAVEIPVLCKDFILSEYQVWEARACGADLVLLILAALSDYSYRSLLSLTNQLGMTALVEVHDQHDLAKAIASDAPIIGINNRDLSDFSVDLITTEYLAPLIPEGTIIVSESGITSREDVERIQRAGATVVLVGEALMRSESPREEIRELLG